MTDLPNRQHIDVRAVPWEDADAETLRAAGQKRARSTWRTRDQAHDRCDPFRNKGIGRALLAAAEDFARAACARRIVLQTGDRQPDAIALYERAGYRRVPIFESDLSLPYSNCFAKTLSDTR